MKFLWPVQIYALSGQRQKLTFVVFHELYSFYNFVRPQGKENYGCKSQNNVDYFHGVPGILEVVLCPFFQQSCKNISHINILWLKWWMFGVYLSIIRYFYRAHIKGLHGTEVRSIFVENCKSVWDRAWKSAYMSHPEVRPHLTFLDRTKTIKLSMVWLTFD